MWAMEHALRMTGSLEPRSDWTATGCTIAKALEEIPTRSTFLILREAFYGTTRFDDFAERVGISAPVTAARLKELVDNGLLERADYREPGQRTRQRYRLTDKGADLFPALVALKQWGDRWVDDRGGPVEFRHRDCGHAVSAELRCSVGHQVTPDELDLVSRRPLARPASRTD